MGLTELTRRVEELEVYRVEAEHRIIPILRNYSARRSWAHDDPRRRAAVMAFVWRLFAPATVALAVGGGGLVAGILSVWLLYVQNEELEGQGETLRLQLEEQERQFSIQRMTELCVLLFPPSSRSTASAQSLTSPEVRAAAAVEYIDFRVGQGLDPSLRGACLTGVRATQDWIDCTAPYLAGANLTGARFSGLDLTGVAFDGSRLTGTRFDGAVLKGATFDGSTIDWGRLDDEGEVQLVRVDLGAEPEGFRFEEVLPFYGAHVVGTSFCGLVIEGWAEPGSFWSTNDPYVAWVVSERLGFYKVACWDGSTDWGGFRLPLLDSSLSCSQEK